jgi:putative ABC transport system permease protein
MNAEISPPKWPLKVLRLFVKRAYVEEIEGDMEEVFQDCLAVHSIAKARRIYTWETLKLLRPVLVKNLEGVDRINQYGMLKNYFRVSLRGLVKNPLNSSINIFGLAIAIGVCVFGYAFARWTYATDQFHEHRNEVHMVTVTANRDGVAQAYGQTPRPLGEMLQADFPAVDKMCRVEDRNVVVKMDDRVFHERVRCVDPVFLDMFTFPLKWSTPRPLHDESSIVLSADMSLKYFGEDNPIGRDILVKFDENISQSFKVTGVANPFPDARTFAFDFLVNYENLQNDTSFQAYDWSAVVNATFIQVKNPSDLNAIYAGMKKYIALQNEVVTEDWAITSFGFESLATLHRASSKIKNDISLSSDSKYDSIGFIIIICLFMLALACFNYINIAIVSAVKRLKEIGVRKTIGATRRVVIFQFLTENVVVTFFALLTGIMLGKFVFIPWIEMINHSDFGFSLADSRLWIYLSVVLLVTAIASGIYPSLYISGFQVAGILKGSVRFGSKNILTKVLLAFQLVLACILITCGVMFTWNTDYMAKRSWGYNQEQALFAAVPDAQSFNKLEAVLVDNVNVLSLSGSKHHLGKSNTMAIVRRPERQFEVDRLDVDAAYFETMGLELVAGRVFRDGYESDKKTVVVNEVFAQSLAVSNPLGALFNIDTVQYEIVGVVRDFHPYSFFRKVNPAIFTLANEAAYRYLSIKVRPGSQLEMARTLEARWSDLFPETPFDGGYQEDVWGGYFQALETHANVWRAFATIAILLASMGLYGLIALNVESRAKEFSIRRVLGAGMGSISRNITRQYVWLYMIAIAIGAPVSYYLNAKLFDFIYYYHIPVTYAGVSVAVGLLVLVLLATVGLQVRRVVVSNPVEGLKME